MIPTPSEAFIGHFFGRLVLALGRSEAKPGLGLILHTRMADPTSAYQALPSIGADLRDLGLEVVRFAVHQRGEALERRLHDRRGEGVRFIRGFWQGGEPARLRCGSSR